MKISVSAKRAKNGASPMASMGKGVMFGSQWRPLAMSSAVSAVAVNAVGCGALPDEAVASVRGFISLGDSAY